MTEKGKKLNNEELQQAVGGTGISNLPPNSELPKSDRFENTGITNEKGWTKCYFAYKNTGDCSFCIHFRTSGCVDGYHQPHG
ncbi:MAG: hypothetical protein ABFD08_00305 [Syntrophomonas sp.]